MEKNIEKMKDKAQLWAEKFDRDVLDMDKADDRLVLTLSKGTMLDIPELTCLIKNFNSVVIEAEAGHLVIWLL